MSVESWQIGCPRCGWANSGANTRCSKCGQPLRRAPLTSAAPSQRERPVLRTAEPAGLLARAIAYIVDSVIVVAIMVPIVFLWKAQVGIPKITPGTAASATIMANKLQQVLGLVAGGALVVIFYYVGSWNILGASPGMLILNLRLVDASGKSPGFVKALVRFLMLVITTSTGIGLLLTLVRIGATKRKQGLHDMLSGTYVIQFLDPQTVLRTARALDAEGQGGAAAAAPPPVAIPVIRELYAPSPPRTDYAPPPPLEVAPATPLAMEDPTPSATEVPPPLPYEPPPMEAPAASLGAQPAGAPAEFPWELLPLPPAPPPGGEKNA
ncbi:MAG: RDD family protein [Candidatus Dormibacteria bacterium]